MTLYPNYLKDLHLKIGAIGGMPRIVKTNKVNKNELCCSDEYIDIPVDEFKQAILNFYSHYKNNRQDVLITKDYTFVIGGKAENKQQLINGLEKIIKKLKDSESEE